MYFEIEPLKILDLWVNMKDKLILYKKPWVQWIKEAVEEKHDNQLSSHHAKSEIRRLNSRLSKREDLERSWNLI